MGKVGLMIKYQTLFSALGMMLIGWCLIDFPPVYFLDYGISLFGLGELSLGIGFGLGLSKIKIPEWL